jgi:hypothetical protein
MYIIHNKQNEYVTKTNTLTHNKTGAMLFNYVKAANQFMINNNSQLHLMCELYIDSENKC